MKFETLGEEDHPAILMFPGMLCSSKSMMPIAERLSRQYDVILAVYDGYDGTGSVYQVLDPDDYVRMLMNIMKNMIRKI